MSNKNVKIVPVLLYMLCASIFLGGCATTVFIVKKAPQQDLTAFSNVEVTKVIVNETTSEVVPIVPAELHTYIIDEIQARGMYQNVEALVDGSEDTLQIVPTIVEYDAGSQALRYWVGFGAGKGRFDVSCQFIDKKTNNVLAKVIFEHAIVGGFFGGSSDAKSTRKHIAKKIAKFLENNK